MSPVVNMNSTMAIAREEIFGPVSAVFKFTDEEEVIRLANDVDVGLAAYIYTRDIGRAWTVSEALEYGMVGGGFVDW
jgi:succinate-semialdehyde dehydrogenase/glutarate-semialdehyde dehydrogenase